LTLGVTVTLHLPVGALMLQLTVAPTRLQMPLRVIEPLTALIV